MGVGTIFHPLLHMKKNWGTNLLDTYNLVKKTDK